MSTSNLSACAETMTPRMFGVPAAYFQGNSLYATKSGATCPVAIMSPLELDPDPAVAFVPPRGHVPHFVVSIALPQGRRASPATRAFVETAIAAART